MGSSRAVPSRDCNVLLALFELNGAEYEFLRTKLMMGQRLFKLSTAKLPLSSWARFLSLIAEQPLFQVFHIVGAESELRVQFLTFGLF